MGNDPAYCADEPVDCETDYRNLHKRDQRPEEHDGQVAVSHFPQAQCDRVAGNEHNIDSPRDQREDKPQSMKVSACAVI